MTRFILTGILIWIFNVSSGQPANDLCSGAIVLNPTSSCFDIDFIGSSYSGISGPSCPNGADQPDLWYFLTINNSASISINGGYVALSGFPSSERGAFLEIYTGTCNNLTFQDCTTIGLTGNMNNFNLDAESYYFRFHVVSDPIYTIVPGEICIDIGGSDCPEINPFSPATACTSYQLPTIAGSNLSGNEAYYSDELGQGTMYLPGDFILESTTLFAFVFEEPCISQQALVITFEGNSVESGLGIPGFPVNGNWNTSLLWSTMNIPDKCDHVTINDDHSINVSSSPKAECGTLEIVNGGELIVLPTYELCVSCP